MKQVYQTPSLTVKRMSCNDVLTVSVEDNTEGFYLGWIRE